MSFARVLMTLRSYYETWQPLKQEAIQYCFCGVGLLGGQKEVKRSFVLFKLEVLFCQPAALEKAV